MSLPRSPPALWTPRHHSQAAVSRSLASVRLFRGVRPNSRVPPALLSPGRNSGPDSVTRGTRQSKATDGRRPQGSCLNLRIPVLFIHPNGTETRLHLALLLGAGGPQTRLPLPLPSRSRPSRKQVITASVRSVSEGRSGGQT